MKEKKFYSLMDENGVIGAKKHDGYQMESDDVTLYAYENFFKSMIYFIDPATGLSVYQINYVNRIDDIEDDLDYIIAECKKRLEKIKSTEEYELQKQVFEKYKEARLFDEKCKSIFQDIQRKRE